jgi:hypothetical protein
MEGIDNTSLIQVHIRFLNDIFGQIQSERKDVAMKYFNRVKTDDPNLFIEHMMDVLDSPVTDEMTIFIVWVLLAKETSPEIISTLSENSIKRILKTGQEELDLDGEEFTHATAKIKQTVDQIKKHISTIPVDKNEIKTENK